MTLAVVFGLVVSVLNVMPFGHEHARQVGIFRLAHREAVDIVAARGQHAGNVRKHAGHVLHQSRQHVTHNTLRNRRNQHDTPRKSIGQGAGRPFSGRRNVGPSDRRRAGGG